MPSYAGVEGASTAHEARQLLKRRHTKAELKSIAGRLLGSQQVNRSHMDNKSSLAHAIVEARGMKSRGVSPDWAGAPDWDLESEI